MKSSYVIMELSLSASNTTHDPSVSGNLAYEPASFPDLEFTRNEFASYQEAVEFIERYIQVVKSNHKFFVVETFSR